MDELTIEEVFHAFLDSAEESAPRDPPGRTPDCLSFRKLEAHVKRLQFLTAEEMRHVNRCPDYCQTNLAEFRKHLQSRAPEFVATAAQRLAAHQESGSTSLYNAAVEAENGRVLGTANVVVTDGPLFANGCYLVFRLAVTEPRFRPEMLPLRLSLSDVGDPGKTVFTFDLPTQANEIVKMRIPDYLISEERWRHVDDTGYLPFAFVIQPIGTSELRNLG
jgi:hypothetical protein